MKHSIGNCFNLKNKIDTDSVLKAWAGISSDISYYLNSHHVDWHVWAMQGKGRPLKVSATSSSGQAEKRYFWLV